MGGGLSLVGEDEHCCGWKKKPEKRRVLQDFDDMLAVLALILLVYRAAKGLVDELGARDKAGGGGWKRRR